MLLVPSTLKLLASLLAVAGATRPSLGPEKAAVELSATPATQPTLVGYWHNFHSSVTGATFPLGQVITTEWDVVNVAYATHYAHGMVGFVLDPAAGSIDGFINDIATLKAAGKTVVLSVGGPNGTMALASKAEVGTFVSSIADLVATYGFDGIDLSIEKGLAGSGAVSNLVAAVKKLKRKLGASFYVSLAPYYPLVQSGGGPASVRNGRGGGSAKAKMTAVASSSAQCLTLLDGLRDELDLVHVRYFGSNSGLVLPDDQVVTEGTVDILVGGSLMLLEGCRYTNPSAKSKAATQFQPLPPHQVGFGVSLGGGFNHPDSTTVQRALTCLVQGSGCGTITPKTTYADFGGIMGWSVNLDKFGGYSFSKAVRTTLDDLTTPSNDADENDEVTEDPKFDDSAADWIEANSAAQSGAIRAALPFLKPIPSKYTEGHGPGNADGISDSGKDKLVSQWGDKGRLE
ncbi:hypothetical protein DYB25_011158 [Aphanomyces astaci]|uniref:GH18 domain-containing protein n=1 Tax=Aphanomyces astaci TaxID=112090 RepID=A0A397C2N2_APHAT|nr:hypothetical protein DYB25_011158 [Aphanomyces astaci]